MTPNPETSLTGSARGAPATHSASVSLALGRLRFSVLLSCWVIGLALLAQTVIWSLVNFTELRWDRSETPTAETALIVKPGPAPVVRSALDDVKGRPSAEPVDPNRLVSGYDRIFEIGSRLARGLGTVGLLALLPLLAVGVLLAAGSATRGVDKTVSAFTWSIVVALLVLPIGELVGLSAPGGAFWSYEAVTAKIDAAGVPAIDARTVPPSDAGDAWNEGLAGSIARYVMLPLAALCAVCMVGLRFDAGVEAGLVRKEDLTLDPKLEAEAGGITPGSLHAGRAATAMQGLGSGVPFAPGPKAIAAPAEGPVSIRQVSPGSAPKRMI